MLDDRVRAVLERLAARTPGERARGLPLGGPGASRLPDHRAVPVRARRAAERLRGARDRRLARLFDDLAEPAPASSEAGIVSLEHDPAKCEAWRSQHRGGRARRLGGAGRGRCQGEPAGDRGRLRRRLHRRRERGLRGGTSSSPGRSWSPGALVVADNVLSHEETLGAYSRARQADPGLESVTVPLDRGLERASSLTQYARVRSPRKGGGPT